MNAFENPQQLVRNDLRIGDTKYEVTQVEQEHVINGKKVILLFFYYYRNFPSNTTASLFPS